MGMKLDTDNPAEALTIHLEMTGIAEKIIDNYNNIEIDNVNIERKKGKKNKCWKHISFNYKEI